MKKIRIYLTVFIVLAGCLFGLAACSANEKALFVESTEQLLTEEYEAKAKDNVVSTDTSGGGAESHTDEVIFEEENKLAVHVCGAVNVPGVYELKEGSRVIDAVLASGGFAQDADEAYVNLATVLTDGDKVRIPTKEEVAEMSQQEKTAVDTGVISAEGLKNSQQQLSDKVNINTAGKDELCTLPGIGQTRAESIIAYRNANGDFLQIEDIMQVSGIKESSFQKIKDKITVK